LPEDWAKDAARRKKVHIPDDVVFKTKPRIALNQVKAGLEAVAGQLALRPIMH
jgi:SRSO17 transposase